MSDGATMSNYILEMKPGAPKGTWAQFKALMNGFVPGWTYDKPQFKFTTDKETAAKIARAIAPLAQWCTGPYDARQGSSVGAVKPPIAFPGAPAATPAPKPPVQQPPAQAAPLAGLDELPTLPPAPETILGRDDEPEAHTEEPPKAGADTNLGAQADTPTTKWSNELKRMMATAQPAPQVVAQGRPIDTAPPGLGAPPPAPDVGSAPPATMSSVPIPTKLPPGPPQLTMPDGFQAPGPAPQSVQPATGGGDAAEAEDGPTSAAGGLMGGGFATDEQAMGNMNPFDYSRLAAMKGHRIKDGKHWIKLGRSSERVYCVRRVNDPTQHGRAWLVEKKYHAFGGEQLLATKLTWGEAVDVVMEFEKALADQQAGA